MSDPLMFPPGSPLRVGTYTWTEERDIVHEPGAHLGNVWAKRPCRLRSHRWVVIGRTELGEFGGRWHREIRRCQRCGSQVHQFHEVQPPKRGRL